MAQASPFLLEIYCSTERNSQAVSHMKLIRNKEDLSLGKIDMEAYIQ